MTEIRELPPRPLPPTVVGVSTSTFEGEDTVPIPGPSLVAPQNAPHPRDESDIEALRACWAPKIKETVASRLPGEQRTCHLVNNASRYYHYHYPYYDLAFSVPNGLSEPTLRKRKATTKQVKKFFS